jgi:thiamine pyrophosphate-dependent acetolactate synthase large subunit-like protein
VPIPRAGKIRFVDMAKAAGYPKACEIADLDDWDRALPKLLTEDGPIFVDLKMEPGEAYPEDFRRLYSIEYRDRFREALSKS